MFENLVHLRITSNTQLRNITKKVCKGKTENLLQRKEKKRKDKARGKATLQGYTPPRHCQGMLSRPLTPLLPLVAPLPTKHVRRVEVVVALGVEDHGRVGVLGIRRCRGAAHLIPVDEVVVRARHERLHVDLWEDGRSGSNGCVGAVGGMVLMGVVVCHVEWNLLEGVGEGRGVTGLLLEWEMGVLAMLLLMTLLRRRLLLLISMLQHASLRRSPLLHSSR